jgi:hypothetical protein
MTDPFDETRDKLRTIAADLKGLRDAMWCANRTPQGAEEWICYEHALRLDRTVTIVEDVIAALPIVRLQFVVTGISPRDLVLNALREHNVRVAMEEGPGLSSLYRTWVEARDRAAGLVLVGGLGCLGVGQMWVPEHPNYAKLPGFVDAPEREARA